MRKIHLWWRREANEDRFLVVVTFVGQGGFSFSSDAGLSGAQYALLFFILFVHFDLIIYTGEANLKYMSGINDHCIAVLHWVTKIYKW